MTRRDFLVVTAGQAVIVRMPQRRDVRYVLPVTHAWNYGGYYTNPLQISPAETAAWHPNFHPSLIHHEWAR